MRTTPLGRILLRLFLPTLVAGCFFTVANAAATNPSSVFVDADKYTSHADQSADLEGNVKVIRGVEQLTCDRAHVNSKTNDITAYGNVVLITPKDYIRAEKLEYNFATHKGTIYKGMIQTGQETIEGELILKENETDYQAIGATYTSCVNCPPSWKVSGSRIDATQGSYAYIKNPVIRVYNVPILWLPYLVVPIKSERQSGLLAPDFSFAGNDDGFGFGDSYFWAIDRSHDATLGVMDYTRRGFKENVEYRFVADEHSKGTFGGHFIDDRYYGQNDTRYTTPDPRYVSPKGAKDFVPRYAIHYDHHLLLPDDFIQNINVNLVRDITFVQDFPRDTYGLNEMALENRANLTKNTEDSHSSLDVDIYENLLKADPTGGDEFTVHRLPEMRYAIMPQHLFGTNFLAKLDVDYLNLSRASRAFDDPFDRQTFQPGDLYRTGQRLLVHPDLMFPINLGKAVDLVPEVEYQEAYYQFGYSNKPTTSRRYLRTSILAKTRFFSIFGEEDLHKGNRYKHEIEPDITYTYVPYLGQEEHQFFGTSELPFLPHYAAGQPVTEFDNLQFDYRDRLVDRNLITIGITNKLIRKKITNGEKTYQEIVRHRISQSFDFANDSDPSFVKVKDFVNGGYLLDSSGNPILVPNVKQPWGAVQSLLQVRLDYLTLSSDLVYYPYQQASMHTSSIGLKDDRGNGFTLGYSQTFAIGTVNSNPSVLVNQSGGVSAAPTQLNGVTARSDALSLQVNYSSNIIDLAGVTTFDLLEHKFTSETVYGLLKPPGKCWGLSVWVERNLNNKPTYGFTIPIFFGEGRSVTVARPPGV